MANQITTSSNFPSGFNNVTLRGIPITQSHPGLVYWVSNDPNSLTQGQISGSDGNPGTFNAPFATLQYAVSRCVHGRGDIIFVKPNHDELISVATANLEGGAVTANALSLYKSNVAIIGLGTGTNRPTLTFTAAAAAIVLGGQPGAASSCTIAALSNTMTLTTLTTGTFLPGSYLYAATIIPGTRIVSQVSGVAGGAGVYTLDCIQPVVTTTATVYASQGVGVSMQNFLFISMFADVATVFKATALSLPKDFALEKCEFRDTSSVLNFLTIVTQPATTANSMDGLVFDGNKISSLGTTAATTAIKFVAANDNVSIRDNFGTWAVLNDTAAMLATGANNVTNFDFGRNRLNKPNTSSTGGSFISTSATAWTGHAYDNYLWQLDASAGIWIATGSKLAFSNNLSPITGAADANGLANPAAV